jgi:hypothetical protein
MTATAAAGTARPLCRWPQLARYSSGEVNRAERFTCR